jgi:uncharacterized cupin superfamily protein
MPHPWDEACHVMEGEARFFLGGKEQLVKAGDFVLAPGGAVHGFHGDSKTPARVLIFDAPAHSEAFFRDLDREGREMPRDIEKVPQIGNRHQAPGTRSNFAAVTDRGFGLCGAMPVQHCAVVSW